MATFDTQKLLADIEELKLRVTAVEGSPDAYHQHTGFDSNQVRYLDLEDKKLYINHTIYGTSAATAANYGVFFIAPVICQVTKMREVHQTAGTDGGAVTLNIEKLTSGIALDSGSTLLATALSLKATVDVVQTGTLNRGSSVSLSAGDRLAMKDAGTLTSVANVTVLIEITF